MIIVSYLPVGLERKAACCLPWWPTLRGSFPSSRCNVKHFWKYSLCVLLGGRHTTIREKHSPFHSKVITMCVCVCARVCSCGERVTPRPTIAGKFTPYLPLLLTSFLFGCFFHTSIFGQCSLSLPSLLGGDLGSDWGDNGMDWT